MKDAILGIDLSPTKCGWGIALDDREQWTPVCCGSAPIERGQPASYHALGRMIARDLRVWGVNPFLCLIEENMQVGKGPAYAQGLAVGMFTVVVNNRWPNMAIHDLNVAAWRRITGVRTTIETPEGPKRTRRLTRAELKERAIVASQDIGFTNVADDDAAEGGLIARAGWMMLVNGKLRRVGTRTDEVAA